MTDIYSIVEQARREQRYIAFLYQREGETQQRVRCVMPSRIQDGLLLAMDLHRDAPRSFIIDKIEQPRLGKHVKDMHGPLGEPPKLSEVGNP